MSATEIRWGVGLLFLGVAASAAIGAATVSGYEWAEPWLWGIAACLLVAGLGTLAWPRLKLWLPGHRKRLREARLQTLEEWNRSRASAIKTIVADYNRLQRTPELGEQRKILEGISDVTKILWQHYSEAAEREEDQPLEVARLVIHELKQGQGPIPLARLREAILMIAGLASLKPLVAPAEPSRRQ